MIIETKIVIHDDYCKNTSTEDIAKTHPRKILQKSYHRSQICFPLLIAAPLPKKPPPPTMKPKEVIRWNDT